jgi:hypothetical protein
VYCTMLNICTINKGWFCRMLKSSIISQHHQPASSASTIGLKAGVKPHDLIWEVTHKQHIPSWQASALLWACKHVIHPISLQHGLAFVGLKIKGERKKNFRNSVGVSTYYWELQ